MAEQRHAGQGGRAGAQDRPRRPVGVPAVLDAGGPVEFTGYAEVVPRVAGRGRCSAAAGRVAAAGEGDDVELVLDAHPVLRRGRRPAAPTTGVITVGGGQVEVVDVQQPVPGLIVHRGRVRPGRGARRRDRLRARSTSTRRRAISRAHTATHLVHQTMRKFLGESATQAGSLNAPGRLRFDFNTPAAVPPSVLHDVEQQVNEVLLDDLEVHAVHHLAGARRARLGAMALFGEKYGDEVRVVEVGDYARELCGGTHVARSGQLGLVKILGEASIGSGVRRVEALVGMDAFGFLAREHVLVGRLAEALKVRPEEVAERVAEHRSAGCATPRRSWRSCARSWCSPRRARWPPAPGTSAAWLRRPPRRRTGSAADDVRTLALDVRGRLGSRPARRGRGGRRRPRRPLVSWRPTRRPASAACAAGDLVKRGAPSAAAAAARTTWPRAAAPTRPRSPRRWPGRARGGRARHGGPLSRCAPA